MTLRANGRVPSPEFWNGRRVLVTGHTGFKGSWLSFWLRSLGADLAGVALPEMPSTPALWSDLALDLDPDIRADIAGDAWQDTVARFDPQILIHLAAQPLVSQGYADPLGTFETNVLGTARVLAATHRLPSLEAVLIATTDKVYDTRSPAPYVETAALGAEDPYAASKVGAELVVSSWPGITAPTVTARAGNVIGGGDWASNRLVPDLVRAWSSGVTPKVRHPDAVRPWQHVVEPLCGYLIYLEDLVGGKELPRALNFGPDALHAPAVRDVASHAATVWGRTLGQPPPTYDVADEAPMKETQFLEIDSTLAAESIGWRGTLDWRAAVELTIEWYAGWAAGVPAAQLIRDQLRSYVGAVPR